MKPLPNTEESLLLRTDYSNGDAWEVLCAEIQAPAEFTAHVTVVNDPRYEGLTVANILDLVPEDFDHMFLLIVDRDTLTSSDHAILVVDLYDEPGRTFRVIPRALWGVENNLSIGNMGFEEFATAVDDAGIFRGFPKS